MKRNLLCMLLAMIMTLSLLPAGALAASFDDVPADAWYAQDVRDIQQYGLIYGVGNNLFEPQGTLSLAQAITLAVRVHALFNSLDIPEQGSPWYQFYLYYADQNGICSYGEFGTDYNGECSRLTMAVLFQRVFPAYTEDYRNSIDALPDVEDSGYGASVFYLYRQGVLTGNDSYGTFRPYNSITRAEAAAILNRVMNVEKRKTFSLAVNEAPARERESLSPREAYASFLQEGGYQAVTRNWNLPPSHYACLDLDGNGAEELLILGAAEMGYQYLAVFKLEGDHVVPVIHQNVFSDGSQTVEDSFYVRYCWYSSQFGALCFSDPFGDLMGGMSQYTLEDGVLRETLGVVWEMDAYSLYQNGAFVRMISEEEADYYIDFNRSETIDFRPLP